MPFKPNKKLLRRIGLAVLVLFVGLAAAEIFARAYLGLGDPPLLMSDPEMDYRFRPSATYRRFGNEIAYNAYSMRSDAFPKDKKDPRELRVMVLGDSVVNGGALSDQSRIATALLQARLRAELSRPVVVGNISAGSWGAVNLLAYVERFGLFDADLVVIVLNSGDFGALPAFKPLGPESPQRKPLLALEELATRYLPRLFKRTSAIEPPGPTPAEVQAATSALEELLAASNATAKTVVLLHHAKDELTGGDTRELQALEAIVRNAGIPVVSDAAAMQAAIESGSDPYRDQIHPNDLGQKILADLLRNLVAERVNDMPASAPSAAKQ